MGVSPWPRVNNSSRLELVEYVDPSENVAYLLVLARGNENSCETNIVKFSYDHLVRLSNIQCDN